jgi:hypothetical protein
MKKTILFLFISLVFNQLTLAQSVPANVNSVIDAEKNFSKLVERKGIKGAFLDVADPDGIVFKPEPVKITNFYNNIANQAGTLLWQPKFARIAVSGDLAFTAGPYVYQNGSNDTDKVFGDYVSIWHADADNKLKLLIDVGIQHPEPETEEQIDFKNPQPIVNGYQSKDPFGGKKIILGTDNSFNHSLSMSTMASYKEFLSPDGRFYFPGFEPVTGSFNIMKFIDNEGITITAETLGVGRSSSNDLAYSYGKARIKKGEIVSNYNYVRIWQLDSAHKWDILLEVFSAIENEQ